MINVGTITLWEMFKMLCTGTDVAKFNNILFKASGKTFEIIQEDFNKKICLTNENSEEVKAWKERNNKQKLNMQVYPVTAYFNSLPPISIRPLQERDPVDNLVMWNASGIQSLDALARIGIC